MHLDNFSAAVNINHPDNKLRRGFGYFKKSFPDIADNGERFTASTARALTSQVSYFYIFMCPKNRYFNGSELKIGNEISELIENLIMFSCVNPENARVAKPMLPTILGAG